MNYSVIDLAYLAGIIDGEGCIECRFLSGRPAKHTSLSILLIVGNTDVRLINWLTATWGGRVHLLRRGGIRDMWVWRLPIRSNRELIEAVRPFLKLKREQIILALEAADLSIARGGGRRVPAGNLARRHAIVEEVALLKRTGGDDDARPQVPIYKTAQGL